MSWASSVTGTTFSPASSLTSSVGIATTNVTSMYAGNANLIANVAGATLSTPVSFAPRSPYCSNANLALRPYRPGPSIMNETGYQALVVVDLDKDGLNDLVVIDNTGYLRAARGTGGGFFTTPYTFGSNITGFNNQATLVTGDFDNDTYVDVAAGNQNAVLIAYGAGNGLAKNAVFYNLAANSYVSDLRAADLNADGYVDLVATDTANNRLAVLLNQTGQNFAAPSYLATGRGPQRCALADYNNDGKIDIATINNTDSTLQLFTNQGKALFGAPATYATPPSPAGIAAGNINADGYPDIVVAGGTNNPVASFLNNGAGGLNPNTAINTAATYSNVYRVDLDGDGSLDVVASIAGAVNRIFWGLGTGSFSATPSATPLSLSTPSVAFGDMNDDGSTDIVAVTAVHRAAFIALNNNNRTWMTQPMVALAGSNPSRLISADINRDGKLDIIATSRYGGGGVSVLRGAGDGNFQSSYFATYSNYISDVRVADLNGDGWPDFAFIAVPTSVALVYLNTQNPNGTFTYNASYATGTAPNGLALADLNNDGAIDMVTANNSNSMSVFTNNGNALFSSATSYALSAVNAVVALDIDADGFQDLAVLGFNNLYTLRNNGDATFTLLNNNALYQGFGLVAADFDMDGREDLMLAQGYATVLYPWMNQGNSTFSPGPGFVATFSYNDIQASDVNGDGFVDILMGAGNAMTIFTGDGALHFMPSSYMAWGGANYITTGDYNADGRMDVASCGSTLSSPNGGPAVSILLYKSCDTSHAN